MKTTQSFKIIIANDHPIVTLGLRSFFGRYFNFLVTGVARNGTELLKILKKGNANTLIIDLTLPRTNSYQLVKDILVLYPKLKVIIFTHYTMEKLVVDMRTFGVHAYLSKSVCLTEIKNVVEQVHENKRIINFSTIENISPNSNGVLVEGQILKDNFTKFSELTEREMDIITLLSRGLTSKEMAQQLQISKHTIDTHRKNMMKKLDLKTGAQLIYFAAVQGIV